MRRFLGTLMLIAGVLGALVAYYSVHWQHRAVTEFVPVPAEILHVEVRRHSGKHTTYSPEITYRYTYKDQAYTSSRVLPFSDSDSRDWADNIVAPYRSLMAAPGAPEAPGKKATAYVNPDDPNEAVLVRQYSLAPYMFSIIAVLVGEIGAGLLLGVFSGGRTTMAAISLDDSGWQLLLPRLNLRKSMINAWLWSAGWVLAVVPLVTHWTFVARQSGAGTSIAWILAGGFLLVLMAVALRRWSVMRHMSDARLRANPVPLKRGEQFSLKLEADAYVPLNVSAVKFQVVCVEHYRERRGNKTNYGTRTRGEVTCASDKPQQVPAGAVLEDGCDLKIDAVELPATSDNPGKEYPYFTWDIRLHVKLDGMTDYAATFPVTVV